MKRPLIAAGIALSLIATGAVSADSRQARPRATGSSRQGSSVASAPARSGASPSSGARVAAPRSGSPDGRSLPQRTAVSRDAGASRQAPAGTRVSAPTRPAHGDQVAVTGSRLAVDRYSRPRDGRYPTGTAVPRGTVGPVYPPHWNHGHQGWYWNNYYWYPYGFGAWGIGWYFYDPWWGAPAPYYYPYGYGYGYGYGYQGVDVGAVRLKVTPRDAEVFVDGGYVGIVDEFDGTFQRLHLETGQHRIEVRKDGFEPLVFDVNVTIGHTLTLRGELQPAVP